MRFGTWNVKSLYRPGSIMAVARELERYKLDLVCRRLDGTKKELYEQGITLFSMGKGKKITNLGQGFSYTRE
jgi:hypothetical protein